MSQKIITNLGSTKIAERVLSLLLDSLSVTRGRIWFISPWLSDVEFSVARAGHYSGRLGGQGDTMTLSELLGYLGRKHEVHVITRPLHQHVSLRTIRKLREKCSVYVRTESDEKLQRSARFEDLMASLTEEIDRLADEVTQHIDTLRCARNLAEQGATLSYVESLHAKLFWTPIGAIVGSANATRSGLLHNPEMVLETSDQDQLDGLEKASFQIQEIAVPKNEYSFSGIDELEDQRVFEVLSHTDRNRLRTLRIIMNRLSG